MLWNIFAIDCTSSLPFWALKLIYNLFWFFSLFWGSSFLCTEFVHDSLQKSLFLLHFIVLTTLRDQLTEIDVWNFYSAPLVYKHILKLLACCLETYHFSVYLEVRSWVIFSSFLVSHWLYLSSSQLLQVLSFFNHYYYSIFTNNYIIIWITITFIHMHILTILVLVVHMLVKLEYPSICLSTLTFFISVW